MRAVRVSILLAATIVCAWFALAIRQAHDIGVATNVISQPGTRTARELREVASLLRSARILNPDLEVDVLRGRLAISEQNLPHARQILEGVVRSEPLNLEGWIWLGGASFNDPREARFALANASKLDPRDVRGR